MIVDHLSRLEKLIVEEKWTKIEENFLDEQLLRYQSNYLGMLYCQLPSLWNHATRFLLPVEKKIEN